MITQDVQVQVYPDSLLDLLSLEGFERQFWEMYRSQSFTTLTACYEALEEKREKYFGCRYFADYNSYRNTRDYVRKKKLTRTNAKT